MKYVIDKYKEDAPNINIPEISEPPCKFCSKFKPQRRFDSRGHFDGVRLCQSGDMYHDFSCYTAKETDAK